MLEKSIYYIRDAQGNPLNFYTFRFHNGVTSYYLTERDIYGSSRLGMVKDTVNMYLSNPLPSYGVIGNRSYQLTNHLGNVLTVINDIVYPTSSDSTNVNGWNVGISNIFDYSPFGVQLEGRTIANKWHEPAPDTVITKDTAYIYNGDFENPPVVLNGTDTLSIDGWIHYSQSHISLQNKYNSQRLTVRSNKGTHGTKHVFSVVPGKTYTISIDLKRNNSTFLSPSSMNVSATSTNQTLGASSGDSLTQSYSVNSIPNGVGPMSSTQTTPSEVNVIVWNTYANAPGAQYSLYVMHNDGTNTFTYTANTSMIDLQIRQQGTYYLDNIKIYCIETDTVINKNELVGGYRFGFNGMERDNNLKGKGNSYNYKKRMFDPRVGRFLSIDPITEKFPFYSPYQFAGNKPTIAIDLDGREESITIMDPQISVDVVKAVNSGDVQKAIYIALKAVVNGKAKISYNGNFNGLNVNVLIQDDLIQTAFNVKKIQKPKEETGFWDSVWRYLKGNSTGGTSDRGGIMFTSSMGQNKGPKALDKGKVDGPIDINLLLSTLGAANAAASGGAQTQIFKMISGWLQNYENGNAIREQKDKAVGGNTGTGDGNNETGGGGTPGVSDWPNHPDSVDIGVEKYGYEGDGTYRQSYESYEKKEFPSSENSRKIKKNLK